MFVFLNGQLVDSSRAAVSIWDGGFLYGDGIFTTLRLYKGMAIDATSHFQRLRRQANLLDLPFALSEEKMTAALSELVRANELHGTDCRARITISRNGDSENPLPLKNLHESESTVLITASTLPAALNKWQKDGISVITLGPAFLRGNLPSLKTLNVLPSLMALRKAIKAGCPEALLFGQDGHLLEGAISNVFLVSGGKLLTPSHEENFLRGRTRERVISSAAQLSIKVDEKILLRGHLKSAQEIFLTNSVREIVPVITVDGKPVGSGIVGPVTRRLQGQYRNDINAALGV